MTAQSRLGAGHRGRVHATFESLCRIPSPTGDERAVADWLTRELGAMGLEVEEDDAGQSVGASAGNLLVRIPGRQRGARAGWSQHPALRAHGHRASDRAARAGARRRRMGERRRRDPRRRQQGGGRGARRARTLPDRAAIPTSRSGSSCCSRFPRRPGCTAPRRLTSAGCEATSATSSIMPRRSARSSSPRPPTCGWWLRFAVEPPTRVCTPSAG